MDESTVTLRQAAEASLAYVERTLEDNDLPSADVREKPGCFYVALEGEEAVGIGGVERFGSEGLIRSVVVEADRRGEGLGSALVDALEATAREDGVERLFLLTTDAESYFSGLGYAAVDRESVPDAVRETKEFRDLCPASATVMRKAL